MTALEQLRNEIYQLTNLGQYPITSATLGLDQSSNDAIIFTTRITDPSRYSITELGLYSNKVTNNASNTTTTIFDFESGDPLKETVSSIDYYLDETETTDSIIQKITRYFANKSNNIQALDELIVQYEINRGGKKSTTYKTEQIQGMTATTSTVESIKISPTGLVNCHLADNFSDTFIF